MPEEFLVTAPKKIEFRPYTEPPLQADEVRVKALVSGIKIGTEMALYSGKTPFLDNRFDPRLRLFLPSDGKEDCTPVTSVPGCAGKVTENRLEAWTKFKVGDWVHGGMAHKPTQCGG